MTTRIHTKLVLTIALALAIVVVTASAAAAGKPSSAINYTEPGSTGYVPKTVVTIPANLANFREPGSIGWVPSSGTVATNAAAAGLDWKSVLIGGGVGLGIALRCRRIPRGPSA